MSLANGKDTDAGAARLTALTVEQAASLLQRAGAKRCSVETLHADVAAGAPLNPDGSINLIAYGAWLVRTLAEREAHG